MPFKSEAQRRYFNANRKELEAQGVDVDEWNNSSRGKKLPARTKEAQVKLARVVYLLKQASKRKAVMQKLAQVIAKQARCWEGYEPVPGKPAYSDNSCRPVGSKKKKEKQAIDFTHPGTIAGLGALAGGLGGFASDPDEDERGRPKSRLNNALLGGLAGGALGYGAGHGLNGLMRKPSAGNTNALGAAAGGTNIGAMKSVTTPELPAGNTNTLGAAAGGTNIGAIKSLTELAQKAALDEAARARLLMNLVAKPAVMAGGAFTLSSLGQAVREQLGAESSPEERRRNRHHATIMGAGLGLGKGLVSEAQNSGLLP